MFGLLLNRFGVCALVKLLEELLVLVSPYIWIGHIRSSQSLNRKTLQSHAFATQGKALDPLVVLDVA
jgi:hypothetical protein